MRRPILLLVPILMWVSGCARNRLLNSNCELPREQETVLDLNDPAQRWHLTDDARFAEDLAIRYADDHVGLHSGNYEGADEYGRAREQCMTTLFGEIANTHKVSEAQVREFLTHRRPSVDLAVVLSFAVFYAAGSFLIAGGLWSRFPPQDGRAIGIIAMLTTSPVISLAGVLSGEVWSNAMEGLQVANSHMSYRAARIPWGQHRLGLFVAGIVLFWIVAVVQYWKSAHSALSYSSGRGGAATIALGLASAEASSSVRKIGP